MAGRKPRHKDDPGGATIELVVNAYLTRKEQLRDSGDIAERTFQEAVKAGKRFATTFGKTRLISDLVPDDFASYRVELAKTRRAVALETEIQQVRSILKSAYEDEGHLNHLGEGLIPSWNDVERKSWRSKLEIIAQQLGVTTDFGSRPFSTVIELFQFRDGLAHARTSSEEKSYRYRGDSKAEFAASDPDWLKKFWENDKVRRVVDDTIAAIDILRSKAGLESCVLHPISDGAFEQDSTR